MSSSGRSPLARTFGARIAAWYFGLFAIGALSIVLVAGWLLSWSLARRDRDALAAGLIRYSDAYVNGGVAVLDSVIAADRAAASYEPLLVRVVAGGRTRMLSVPLEWSRFDLDGVAMPAVGATSLQRLQEGAAALEVLSARLPDRTVIQVGRSTAPREAVLDRYREVALLTSVVILLAGLAGGLALTASALRPLDDLRATLTRILETGRTTERVPVRGTSDQLDALGGLVNRMLDRIGGLVEGMRSTLDTVAHDLRTPMTRLRGSAELALQSARSADELREALADCIEEADRVRLLLDSLMDVAEAETGAMRLGREGVSLTEIVRSAVDLYVEVADDHRVSLSLDAPDDPLRITGDRARLTQVFANLIDNAVKYTPSGGRVTVALRSAAAGVEVSVEDTGPGIREEDRPRIWERLYRGDESRSRRGLGLGLSLVRAIVEAHGGRATVESQLGRGSRFTVWLPREMTQL
jgi:signal transduction histidine kinase